ncbi:MAG: pentapeptide repeat-containing protein [Rhodospirillales bacterium]|nr:pentapeptide repeat-containing protein [Rhodospirillales bacterium]
MKRRGSVVLAGLIGAALLLALGLPAAQAACTDTPQPGVDWRRCLLDNRNFVDVDLAGATLREGFFARSDLTGADFSAVDGRRAKFTDAVLEDTSWAGARLIGTDFTKSDLSGASFEGADLRRARFFRADLRGVDFTGARLDGTDFLKADLSGAIWIDGNKVCAEGSSGQCN